MDTRQNKPRWYANTTGNRPDEVEIGVTKVRIKEGKIYTLVRDSESLWWILSDHRDIIAWTNDDWA